MSFTSLTKTFNKIGFNEFKAVVKNGTVLLFTLNSGIIFLTN